MFHLYTLEHMDKEQQAKTYPNTRHAWSLLIELAVTLSIICWHRPRSSLSSFLLASPLSPWEIFLLICPDKFDNLCIKSHFFFYCFAWNAKVTNKLWKCSVWVETVKVIANQKTFYQEPQMFLGLKWISAALTFWRQTVVMMCLKAFYVVLNLILCKNVCWFMSHIYAAILVTTHWRLSWLNKSHR